MKYDHQFTITFYKDEPFDVDFVNRECSKRPNAKTLIEVQNTKGITPDMIRRLGPNCAIRIAGGYDKDRLNSYKGQVFGNESAEDYYFNSVIYTKNEVIQILEEIEKIEAGIDKNWSSIQKLLYIYDRLKTGIMYDPKFEHKLSGETRSLRGLITKQTVCAGYALIFKEFMDRNNIQCEFTRGGTVKGETCGHAWNIVTIDGKNYPIDLTWDNTNFRKGQSTTFDWLGADIASFSSHHYPAPQEKIQNYKSTLSQIDPRIIKRLYMSSGIGRSRDYSKTTYYGKRKDGTKFVVAQIGDISIDNVSYYRYFFVELKPDGTQGLPVLLYSETNLTSLVQKKLFNKPYSQKYEEDIDNVLFGRDNIKDSLDSDSYYIGSIKEPREHEQYKPVSSHKDIPKDRNKSLIFRYPTRRYRRSDGTTFVAQQMLDIPLNINGIDVMRYDIFEFVEENGKRILKRNTVFTEKNFFLDNRQEVADDYLRRSRLDRKVKEAGGYIGYLDKNGRRTYNPDLVRHFTTSKTIDITKVQKNINTKPTAVKLPRFEKLKDLAMKYEVEIDLEHPDLMDVKVVDRKTKEVVTDQYLKERAILANIWLIAAGVHVRVDEPINGITEAFSKRAENLYYCIFQNLYDSCKQRGTIDTVDLFKRIDDINDHHYNSEILVNLFRTPYQTNLINKMVFESLGEHRKDNAPMPETLYTLYHAGELAYGEDKKISV